MKKLLWGIPVEEALAEFDKAIENGQCNGRSLLITWREVGNDWYEWTSKEVDWTKQASTK